VSLNSFTAFIVRHARTAARREAFVEDLLAAVVVYPLTNDIARLAGKVDAEHGEADGIAAAGGAGGGCAGSGIPLCGWLRARAVGPVAGGRGQHVRRAVSGAHAGDGV
jgi:hypothetical protein